MKIAQSFYVPMEIDYYFLAFHTKINQKRLFDRQVPFNFNRLLT
ncbi:hypothetical protein [Neobacillus sp. 19]